MIKTNKGFLQAGIIIGVASLFAAGLILSKIDFSSVFAGTGINNDIYQYKKNLAKECGDKPGKLCKGTTSGDTGKEIAPTCTKTASEGCLDDYTQDDGHGGKKLCYTVRRPNCGDNKTPSPTPTPTMTPTPTPTMTPTPTPTETPSPTPTPNSRLIICKYNDSNNNGQIDNGEGTIGWTFNYSYQGNNYQTSSGWWNFWNSGCTTVNVPANQWISVSEQGQNGWFETGVYMNGTRNGNGSVSYVSQSGSDENVSFLNFNSGSPTPTPTATPNSCGGTCGSNSNCQGGLFCFNGYCRNPNCQNDSSCGCATPNPTAPPVVLGATAPPVLPKTGSDDLSILAGLLATMGTGAVLFKKFKLI